MTDVIYHLAKPSVWAGSTDRYSPPSVDDEGFVHCSTAEQLPRVAREMYIDHNDLILLTIAPGELDHGTLVFEDCYERGEEFPHVYGSLPTSAVVATGPYLAHLEEGLWSDQRFDPDWMELILHPEYSEVGRSGGTRSRDEILDSLRQDLRSRVRLEDYTLELVDEDVALVRYTSHDTADEAGHHVRRTSIWVNTNEGWRLRFHQGTAVPPIAPT